jgi:hypothetical protein
MSFDVNIFVFDFFLIIYLYGIKIWNRVYFFHKSLGGGIKAMYAMQRRKEILRIIKENGFKPVSELRDVFQVSEVTIRSDLRYLQQAGKI